MSENLHETLIKILRDSEMVDSESIIVSRDEMHAVLTALTTLRDPAGDLNEMFVIVQDDDGDGPRGIGYVYGEQTAEMFVKVYNIGRRADRVSAVSFDQFVGEKLI
jgi:hypothetical protein